MQTEHRMTGRFTVAALMAAACLWTSIAEADAIVDPPLSATSARTFWRWIGIRTNPDNVCPTPSTLR